MPSLGFRSDRLLNRVARASDEGQLGPWNPPKQRGSNTRLAKDWPRLVAGQLSGDEARVVQILINGIEEEVYIDGVLGPWWIEPDGCIHHGPGHNGRYQLSHGRQAVAHKAWADMTATEREMILIRSAKRQRNIFELHGQRPQIPEIQVPKVDEPKIGVAVEAGAAEEATTGDARKEEGKKPLAYVVVGGTADKGIVVRKGPALSSEELPRLARGARVEELERQGDRIRFKKLDGAGPESGWASIETNGKELLKAE